MKKHRFFIEKIKTNNNNVIIENRELFNQIRDVLRFESGREFIILDNEGNEFACTLTKLQDRMIYAKVIGKKYHKPILPEINLYCSIIKRNNFEFIVQKTTEIGLTNIIPIISKRTIKIKLNKFRLEKIAREAAELSEKFYIPKVYEPVSLKKSLELSKENDINLFLDIKGESISSFDKDIKNSKKIGIFIGPEGGWQDDEIILAMENNFKLLNISPFTLRAETAAIIGTYTISSLI